MYNLRRSHLCITLFCLRHHIACQLHKGHTSHGVFVEGSRCSCIATLADALHDRNLSEQRHIQLFCQTLGSFLTKQVIFVFRKFCRSKPGHVFHQTENRYVHLVVGVHVDTFTRIGQRYLLRRADNHGSRNGQCAATKSGECRLVARRPYSNTK